MEHSKQEKSRGFTNNVDGYLSTPQAFIAHVSFDVLATRDADDSSFLIDTGAIHHVGIRTEDLIKGFVSRGLDLDFL